MRSKSYCINITPIAWNRIVPKNRSYDNDTRFNLHLAQQHNEEPLFSKPLDLSIVFYMPLTNKTYKQNDYHSNHPLMNDLYRFVLHSLKDTILSDDRLICSLSLKKVYDNEPRTEIIITEVV
jgi:Holliday junction resolvase RusA-like endonuclease